VTLEFAETQSYFVIFRHAAADSVHASETVADFPTLKPMMELDGAWQVAFDPKWGGPEHVEFARLQDWTAHADPGIKYYSGTACYRKTVEVSALRSEARVYLDLGVVKHITEVKLNGKDLGVVWTAPWRLDVTGVLKRGRNTLEIAVTNVWANRLIGDEQHPADIVWEMGDPRFKSGCFLKEFPDWFLKNEPRPVKERLTFTTWNYFEKDSPLVSSGLLGPVRLLREA
jgi:hypothetical protein